MKNYKSLHIMASLHRTDCKYVLSSRFRFKIQTAVLLQILPAKRGIHSYSALALPSEEQLVRSGGRSGTTSVLTKSARNPQSDSHSAIASIHSLSQSMSASLGADNVDGKELFSTGLHGV